jgi:Uma2 family endonuclease
MRSVPRVPPFDRPATYDDLVKLPDTVVAEIVDGELHASPRPAPRHAHAEFAMSGALGPARGSGPGSPSGWRILPEAELHLGHDVVVPDFAGWRHPRLLTLPETAYIVVSPDWVCEIVSPSTARLDRSRKLAIYARERVGHAWLLDPVAQTLEVLRLEGARWSILATHAGDEVARAEPFTELELELRLFWAD